ncbi:MAG: hypothetical protein JXA42_10200 [Anaerolineales bacterium]|nr:hypothetical protein [Anaerolineales bacterium]
MNNKNRTSRKRRIVYTLIILLVLLIALLLDLWFSIRTRPNRNVLAISYQSSLAVDESVEVVLQPPVELDSMTRKEVLELRRQAVNRYPELLAGPYRPSDAVFKQIEDGRPWWGIPGEFYYGPGEQSILGASEESRFILNPFLLAAAEFYQSSGMDGIGMWDWDKARIPGQDLDRAGIPYYCPPQDLSWQPGNSYAQVTFDLTSCLAQINRWLANPCTLDNLTFFITAYNARDLNLNYLQLVQTDSQNVALAEPFDAPIPETEFIHQGGSCQYPGGCNNASPYVPQLNDLSLEALPARLVIYLWKDEPDFERLSSPDLRFILYYK